MAVRDVHAFCGEAEEYAGAVVALMATDESARQVAAMRVVDRLSVVAWRECLTECLRQIWPTPLTVRKFGQPSRGLRLLAYSRARPEPHAHHRKRNRRPK
jgi:hypothetical protein